jgi:branched-chain amino acid transport system ATP-binding protein
MPILEGAKITKHFGGLAAVTGLDFHISEREIVGLIGPNGAGKTTLFNLISGALLPTSGTVRFKGKNVTRLNAHEICRLGVARTFQAGDLFPKMTVLENVLLGVLFGTSGNMARSDAEREALELLELVGLSEKERLVAKDLTLAAQKSLEIARALATKPELLLLDEVMAGSNPREVTQSLELIEKIHNKGITVFLIEHVMKAIMGVSERIIVLHHGQKIAEGTPEEISTSKTVIKVYLGE